MDIEKTKVIVDLYKHEDNLLWTKTRFMLLFNSGLVVAWKFLILGATGSTNLTGGVLAVFGFVCNLMFILTLHGSKRHITAYRDFWSDQLFGAIGPKFAGASPLRLTTTSVSITLALLIATLWLVAFIISLMGISILGAPAK